MPLATLAALLFMAADAGPSPSAARPRVDVVFVDLAGVGVASVREAASETAAVLGEAGVHATWSGADADDVREGTTVRVVLLPRAPGASVAPHVLAATEQGVAASAWVYVPHLRRAVGPTTETAFARALGRVVAHELVHAVAPDVVHARTGLMQKRLSRDTLLAERAGFDRSSAEALRGAAMARAARSTGASRAI